MVSTNYTIGTLTVFKDNAIEALILSLSPDQLLKIIYDLSENYSKKHYTTAEALLCFNGKEFAVVDPTNTWRPLNDAECLLLFKSAVAAYKETVHLTALDDAIDYYYYGGTCCGRAKKPMLFYDIASEVDQLVKAEAKKKRTQRLQATFKNFARTLDQLNDQSDLRFGTILPDAILVRLLTQGEEYADPLDICLQRSISDNAYKWDKIDNHGDVLSVLDIQSIAIRAFRLCGNADTARSFWVSIAGIKLMLQSYKGYHSHKHVDKNLNSILDHLSLKRELFELQEAEKKEKAALTPKTLAKVDFPKIVEDNLSAFIASIGGELSSASIAKLMQTSNFPVITEVTLRDLQRIFNIYQWYPGYPDQLITVAAVARWQEVHALYQKLKDSWLKHGATSYAL